MKLLMQRKHKEKGIIVCEKANLWAILYSDLSKILIYSNVFKILNLFWNFTIECMKWKYECVLILGGIKAPH